MNVSNSISYKSLRTVHLFGRNFLQATGVVPLELERDLDA
ncbi:MAG: hypothetical protein JWO48_1460 [Bryobacterales bacterium]|nr:hypothetical protein [Bryobacterales bacterium]